LSKILVVDDNRSIRNLLKTLLELEHHLVYFPKDTKEENVITQIRNDPPNLIIMDVFLSGANGLEILSKIREDKTILPTRIFITSGTDLTSEAMAAGADGFLMKPYMPDQLIQLIK